MTALVLATAARRSGLRELLSAGAGLVVAGSGLSAAAPSFAVLGAAQAVLGVGIGLLVAVGIAASGEPGRRLGLIAGRRGASSGPQALVRSTRNFNREESLLQSGAP